MARATRPNQVIRRVLFAFVLGCAMTVQAHGAGYRGKGYAFMVPKGWTARPGYKTADVLVMSPQKGANFNVVSRAAEPGQTVEAGMHDLILRLETTPNYKRLALGRTRLGGATAWAVEYAYDAPGRGRVRARQVLVVRNKKAVVVTAVTKANAWQRIWPAFNGMFASFRWTK